MNPNEHVSTQSTMGDELLTYPSPKTSSINYATNTKRHYKKATGDVPPTDEQIKYKYQILNQDPEHMINKDDLELVFGSTSTTREQGNHTLNVHVDKSQAPRNVNIPEQPSQRQQYIQKKENLSAQERRMIHVSDRENREGKSSKRPVSVPLRSARLQDSSQATPRGDFDEGIRDLDKTHLLQFLSKELHVRAAPSFSSTGVGVEAVDSWKWMDTFDLKDEWSNGVLLSEMTAALIQDQKDLVKQVSNQQFFSMFDFWFSDNNDK
jgi:hypothetical protein